MILPEDEVIITKRTGLTRRSLVRGLSGLATAAAFAPMAPSISRAADRPGLTCGLQSGDVSADSAVVWARGDRPARLLVEASTTESFRNIVASTFVDVLPESDLTGKVLLDELPFDQDIFYRVTCQDLASPALARPIPDGPVSHRALESKIRLLYLVG